MPASQSLYRKYRSQSFDELVGQEPVVRTLKNAIATGRIGHAYLFTGPRGVGKTSAARLLARAANCTAEPDKRPCNECPNCIAATRDIATDLIEIDAASNTGVDNIRELIERANFAPSIWNTKFYIIDEVHMLSVSAFNALLKTLEEPPAHTSFILATTEIHKVPATVASRCQRFDFRRIPLKAMLARLEHICHEEGIEAETSALELVSRQATGSLRDAESLLDQLRVFAEGSITLSTVQDMLGAGGSEEVATFIDTLISRDLAAGLHQINGALEDGLDLRQYNRQVVEHLRGLLLVKSGAAGSGTLLDVTDDMRTRLQKQAAEVTMPDLLRWIKTFSEADLALRSSAYGQLPLEMAFIAAALPPALSAPVADVKDHRVDIAVAATAVGQLPARSAPAARPDPRAVEPASAPPPIHKELHAFNQNGNGHIPAFEPPPHEPELEAEAGDSVTPAPTAEELDDPTRLASLWPRVLDQIRARSPRMASVFANPELVKPVQSRNGVCVISFRDAFWVKQAMSNTPKPYRETLETSLSRVLGVNCTLECITFAQAEKGGWEDQPAPTPRISGKKQAGDKPSPLETTRGQAAANIFGIDKFSEPE